MFAHELERRDAAVMGDCQGAGGGFPVGAASSLKKRAVGMTAG